MLKIAVSRHPSGHGFQALLWDDTGPVGAVDGVTEEVAGRTAAVLMEAVIRRRTEEANLRAYQAHLTSVEALVQAKLDEALRVLGEERSRI